MWKINQKKSKIPNVKIRNFVYSTKQFDLLVIKSESNNAKTPQRHSAQQQYTLCIRRPLQGHVYACAHNVYGRQTQYCQWYTALANRCVCDAESAEVCNLWVITTVCLFHGGAYTQGTSVCGFQFGAAGWQWCATEVRRCVLWCRCSLLCAGGYCTVGLLQTTTTTTIIGVLIFA